jgi:hypothetical protein
MNLPPCPDSRPGGDCPRSQPALGGESDDHIIFVCHTCHGIWVLSKPRTIARARYENELEEARRLAQHQPYTAYSLPGGS